MTATTVIKCLQQLFSLFGMPAYVHSDRGAQFMSAEVASFLTSSGVSQSRTTPYNPSGNGQCERYNGTIWKAIQLALKDRALHDKHWETVLAEALHAVRSLLCTATNATPHERFLSFTRRSSSGSSIPSWLSSPGPVLLRRYVRNCKSDPLVDEVDLLLATPNYAHIRRKNGSESTVSLRDLAPIPRTSEHISERPEKVYANSPNGQGSPTDGNLQQQQPMNSDRDHEQLRPGVEQEHPLPMMTGSAADDSFHQPDSCIETRQLAADSNRNIAPRRSQRMSVAPDRLNL